MKFSYSLSPRVNLLCRHFPAEAYGMREIPLTEGYVAKVDDADFEKLDRYAWSVSHEGQTHYAVCHLDPCDLSRNIRMHRMIMHPHPYEVVDHIDGNGLNNQRSNLRNCSQRENSRNLRKTRGSSQYKGVSRCSDRDKWRAQIRVEGKNKLLGYFDDEAEAARLYDAAALKHFGSFARLNFGGGGDREP